MVFFTKIKNTMLGHRECDGTCQQGEGDCDRDEDCLPGLVCNFDWWFGTDTCQAGRFHYKYIMTSVMSQEVLIL